MTTPSNLEDRKKGISMKALPQTIRDAIEITRTLGIRYIWIDALCILQAGCAVAQADWARESSRMSDVYGGAFLKIHAASATCVHDDIIGERHSVDSGFELHLGLDDSDAKHRSGLPQISSPIQGLTEEPLYYRGWTLQERVLFPRVLIYTSEQLAWECKEQSHIENGVPMYDLGKLGLESRLLPSK
jgi:hypothetical protein